MAEAVTASATKYASAETTHDRAPILRVTIPNGRDLKGSVRHGFAKAVWPHVRPVLLDEGQAVGTGALTEHHPPARGYVGERRPQTVLVLVVHQDEERPRLVIEWVVAHRISSLIAPMANRRSGRRQGGYLVGPYPEARQCGGTEGVAERDVSGVAATRNQHPADARRVVARVEGMPLPVEEYLEPGREIHRLVHRGHTDVAEVPGAVARRNVHAATEGNGKMREITADADPLVKGFQSSPGHARVFIAEREMSVNVIANCLNAAPSSWCLYKEIPRRLG